MGLDRPLAVAALPLSRSLSTPSRPKHARTSSAQRKQRVEERLRPKPPAAVDPPFPPN